MTVKPKNPQVVKYIEGMHAWRAELEAVRPLLLGAGLDEELKWYKPCYSYGGTNVVIFQPFKELCALLFFKGALLQDPDGALREQGENTRSALRLEFRSVADVTAAKRTIESLVQDAIRVEEAEAPSSPRPGSRVSSARHHASWKASGCTTSRQRARSLAGLRSSVSMPRPSGL